MFLKIKNLSGEDIYRGLKETCRTHQVAIFPVWKSLALSLACLQLMKHVKLEIF